MNAELDKIWNKAAVVKFKLLIPYTPGETEENYEEYHSG
jgi:hypothetical protein